MALHKSYVGFGHTETQIIDDLARMSVPQGNDDMPEYTLENAMEHSHLDSFRIFSTYVWTEVAEDPCIAKCLVDNSWTTFGPEHVLST